MSEEVLILFSIVTLFVIFSPIYFQNRKISRMVEEDLKQLNYEEWKKHIRTNVYIKLFSRIIWGLVIVSGFIFNFSKIYAQGFRWINLIVLLIGLAFIVWGVFGFRREIKQVQNLK